VCTPWTFYDRERPLNPPLPDIAAARAFALGLIVVGFAALAFGSGWVTLPGSPLAGPQWVVCSIGVGFMFAGLLAGQWWPSRSVLSDGLAATMMTLFGLASGWIAIFGEHLQSRIGVHVFWTPLSWWAHAIFGLAALAFLALAVFGWWRTLTNRL
jgi:hypothetical protein